MYSDRMYQRSELIRRGSPFGRNYRITTRKQLAHIRLSDFAQPHIASQISTAEYELILPYPPYFHRALLYARALLRIIDSDRNRRFSERIL